MLVTFRGLVCVKSTTPRSGERSRALRVFGPPSSHPGRSLPTSPLSRSSWNVMPSLTWPTPFLVIFWGAAAEAGTASIATTTAAAISVRFIRARYPRPTTANAKPSWPKLVAHPPKR